MIALDANIATYSPRKNMPNFMALYSIWKPATISLSPSARSKGVRLHLGKGGDDEDDDAEWLENHSPHRDEAKEQITLESAPSH